VRENVVLMSLGDLAGARVYLETCCLCYRNHRATPRIESQNMYNEARGAVSLQENGEKNYALT
jgi:hypothetical protein